MNTVFNHLYQKHLSRRFWCLMFFLSLIGFSVERWHFTNAVRDGYKFLVIDDDTFYYPRKLDFRQAHELHFEQAHLACQTLLNRHPGGIDSELRLKSLFHTNAYRQAMELIQDETPMFENGTFCFFD